MHFLNSLQHPICVLLLMQQSSYECNYQNVPQLSAVLNFIYMITGVYRKLHKKHLYGSLTQVKRQMSVILYSESI